MSQPVNVECCKCGYPVFILEADLKRLEAGQAEIASLGWRGAKLEPCPKLASVKSHLAELRHMRNRITGERVTGTEHMPPDPDHCEDCARVKAGTQSCCAFHYEVKS